MNPSKLKILKTLIFGIGFLVAFLSFGQKTDIYKKGGYAVSGYDVVSYFNNKVQKGNKSFQATYQSAVFLFSTAENAELFKGNPAAYAPQYGGHCSYAMAVKGEKVSSDPNVYEVRDGKLHLFHQAEGLTNWKKEGPEKLRAIADENWKKIISESH